MVFHGLSRGCEACRKRRVKCDENRPHCGNCVRRKQQFLCKYRQIPESGRKANSSPTGSESGSSTSSWTRMWIANDHPDFDTTLQFNNDTARLETLDLIRPRSSRDLESLHFFFNNYIDVPRENGATVLADHIIPMYRQASSDSPLKPAVEAFASGITDLWRRAGPDSTSPRRLYGDAIAGLRERLRTDSLSSDELLATIYMLDLHEAVNRRYAYKSGGGVHQKAAMGIVQHYGRENLQSISSRKLFIALRARYIWTLLQSQQQIELDEDMLRKDYADPRPGTSLALVMADLANLLSDAKHSFSVDSGYFDGIQDIETGLPSPRMTAFDLLDRSITIDSRLDQWEQELPPKFQKHRIRNLTEIHPTIKAAGLYNGLCDVYSILSVCTAYNGWRLLKILSLRVRSFFLTQLDDESLALYDGNPHPATAELDSKIQALADDICASVPYYLGNRTDYTLPNEPQEYPPIPLYLREMVDFVDAQGQPRMMTINDHAYSAAVSGGWFVITALSLLLHYAQPIAEDLSVFGKLPRLGPIKLRPGQVPWIAGQLKRIAKIYDIPWPPPKPPRSEITPEEAAEGTFQMPPGLGRGLSSWS